jgi:hypothetical protein
MRAARWLGFGLALAVLPALAFAQVFKWVDEQGRIHYSDVAPPQPAQTFKPDQVDTQESSADLARREQEFLKRRADEEQQAARHQEDQSRAARATENCLKARNNLVTLETAERIADTSIPGTAMTEAARAQLREATLRDIDHWCKN